MCGERKRREASTGAVLTGPPSRRSRFRQDNVARHTFVEQELGGLDTRIGMKPADDGIVPNDVGERSQRHPLVMSEERLDDGTGAGPVLFRVLRGVAELRREVDGFVETERAVEPIATQAPEVLDRGRRIDQRARAVA